MINPEDLENEVLELRHHLEALWDVTTYLIAVLDIGDVIADDVTNDMLDRADVKAEKAFEEVVKRRKEKVKRAKQPKLT